MAPQTNPPPTITPYRHRTCDMAHKVMVYRNLNNRKLSVLQDGRVVGHTAAIMLCACTFVVKESARQRVLRDQKKNVHAFVKGMVCAPGFQVDRTKFPYRDRVRYNPYEHGRFLDSKGRPVDGSPYVEVLADGSIYIYH